MVIQPEDNLDPAVGPAHHSVEIVYDPSLSEKELGKGRSSKGVWFL